MENIHRTTLIVLSILILTQSVHGQIEEFKNECEETSSLVCYYIDDKEKILPHRVDTKIPSLRIPIPEDMGGAIRDHFTVRVWQPIKDVSKPNYDMLIVNNWIDDLGKDVTVKNGGGSVDNTRENFPYPYYGVLKTAKKGKYKTTIFVFISRGDEYESYDTIDAEVILYKVSEEGDGGGGGGCTTCHSSVERIPTDSVIRGSSFDIVGIVILSMCLVVISLSSLRIKRI